MTEKIDRLPEFLKLLYFVEGYYSDDIRDRGGPTCYGVTQKTYNSFCMIHDIQTKNVKELTEDERTNFYRLEFYLHTEYHANKEIHYNLFDAFVNGGPKSYKHLLEGLKKDDKGRERDVYSLRRERYREIAKANPTYGKVYLKGWYNRLRKIKMFFNGSI